MNNVFLVTTLPEGLPREETESYLQRVQKVAGKYNFRIVGAVIDHTKGEFPFFNDVLALIGDVISSAQCDAIILDDSYGYVMSESYEKLSELTDSYNTAIFHYEDDDIYMPDQNEDFDYDEEPFSVYELTVDEEPSCDWYDTFSEGISVICEDFKKHVANMPICDRFKETSSFVDGMLGAARVLIEESDVMQDEMKKELEELKKKTKKK